MRGKYKRYDSEKTRIKALIIIVIGAFLYKLFRIAGLI